MRKIQKVPPKFYIKFIGRFKNVEGAPEIKFSSIGNIFYEKGRNRSGKSTALRSIAFLLGWWPEEHSETRQYYDNDIIRQFENIKNNVEAN